MTTYDAVFTLFVGAVLGFAYIVVPMWVVIEEKKKADARGIPADFVMITAKAMIALIFSATIADKLFLGTLQAHGIDVEKYKANFIAWSKGENATSTTDLTESFKEVWDKWGL
jgi:hypothetical protein